MSEIASTSQNCFLPCVYFTRRNTLENFQLKQSLPDAVMLSGAKWNTVNHVLFSSKLSLAFKSALSLSTLVLASLMLTDTFCDSEMESTSGKGLKVGCSTSGAHRLLQR